MVLGLDYSVFSGFRILSVFQGSFWFFKDWIGVFDNWIFRSVFLDTGSFSFADTKMLKLQGFWKLIRLIDISARRREDLPDEGILVWAEDGGGSGWFRGAWSFRGDKSKAAAG